jgi:hypothetical protein
MGETLNVVVRAVDQPSDKIDFLGVSKVSRAFSRHVCENKHDLAATEVHTTCMPASIHLLDRYLFVSWTQ